MNLSNNFVLDAYISKTLLYINFTKYLTSTHGINSEELFYDFTSESVEWPQRSHGFRSTDLGALP